jgi:hypothetical protein
MKLSAPVKVNRIDILCTEHNIPLDAPHQVPTFKPLDPGDMTCGWEAYLDELECPDDAEGNCVDSWEVHLVAD